MVQTMVELSHWKNVVVPQRHETGCIPTGLEWVVRYLGITGVALGTFQEDFDLGQANNFSSVAEKVGLRYPHINIRIQSFQQGLEKVRTVVGLVERDTPCLISLALAETQRIPEGILVSPKGWHIMPVVYADDQKMKMIHSANENGNQVWELPIMEVIWRHINLEGGKDIVWLEEQRTQVQRTR
jgi:hypothetical protein